MIKLEKQHVPASAEEWYKEVEGIRRFLAQMKATKMGMFDYWRKGMVRHYTERLKFLLLRKPRGVK